MNSLWASNMSSNSLELFIAAGLYFGPKEAVVK